MIVSVIVSNKFGLLLLLYKVIQACMYEYISAPIYKVIEAFMHESIFACIYKVIEACI